MRLPASAESMGRRAAMNCALAVSALVAPNVVPGPAHAISATTMSGKTRPDLGVVLVDEVQATGTTISANMVLSGGLIATAVFESSWPLAEGSYYDVETKSRDGDNAFVQVRSLPKGKTVGSTPARWFTDAILSVEGRYGAYGAPTDVKVLSDNTVGDTRTLEVSFTALSPGMAEVPRRALVAATQAAGSPDALMLTTGSSATRWKKAGSGETARVTAASFRVAGTKPTQLQRVETADYRYGKTSGPESMRSRNDGF